MQRVKSKDTTPELMARRFLYHMGIVTGFTGPIYLANRISS